MEESQVSDEKGRFPAAEWLLLAARAYDIYVCVFTHKGLSKYAVVFDDGQSEVVVLQTFNSEFPSVLFVKHMVKFLGNPFCSGMPLLTGNELLERVQEAADVAYDRYLAHRAKLKRGGV
jgi:hypothetical protein